MAVAKKGGRGPVGYLAVFAIAVAVVLLLSWAGTLGSRSAVLAAARTSFTATVEAMAADMAASFFMDQGFRDAVPNRDTEAIDRHLDGVRARFPFAVAARVEPGFPPPAPYRVDSLWGELVVVFPIAGPDGLDPLPDRRAAVDIGAQALLVEVQPGRRLWVTPDGGEPLAYGLRARFVQPALTVFDLVKAVAVGLLGMACLRVLRRRRSGRGAASGTAAVNPSGGAGA